MWPDMVHYVTYRALRDGFMHTCMTVSRSHKNSPASLSLCHSEVRLGEEDTLDLFLSHRGSPKGCVCSLPLPGLQGPQMCRRTGGHVQLLRDALNLKSTQRHEPERWLRSCQGSTRLHESPQHDIALKGFFKALNMTQIDFLGIRRNICTDGFVNYIKLPLQYIKTHICLVKNILHYMVSS